MMSETYISAIGVQAIKVALMIAGPVLLVSMIVGLLISILQALTQIQEQTLTFVPKILCVFLVLIIAGAFMINTLLSFTNRIFSYVSNIVG